VTVTSEQRMTLLIVLGITVAILVWDYALLRDGIPGNTISGSLKTASECLPIPLLFGIWMAHSWWYQPGSHTPGATRLAAFIIVVLALYLWWEISDDQARIWLSKHPAVTFQAGFVSGHWLWPQFTVGIGG